MLKIKTHVLQNLVAKASIGASNNKMLPITSMLGISVNSTPENNSCLTLKTTDATNYLFVSDFIDATDSFEVVVPQEQFSKLVSKITTETISLEIDNGKLIVEGNGKYQIELPLNEEGELVKFPNPLKDLVLLDSRQVGLNSIKSVLLHNKPALATSTDVPCYTGYYMDKGQVITTDTYIMCGNEIGLFETPALLSRELVDLLDVFNSTEINIFETDNNILFTSDNCMVYGVKMQGIEEYQVEALKGLLEQDFPSMVKLSRNRLINSLDRLNLFVGKYDNNKIKLEFSKDGLVITSKAASGKELIEYSENSNFSEFTCYIDIEMMIAQLKAQECDIEEIWYGRENAIKLIDGDVTQVLALDEE